MQMSEVERMRQAEANRAAAGPEGVAFVEKVREIWPGAAVRYIGPIRPETEAALKKSTP